MSRDFRLYLDDMIAAGEKALRYTRGMRFAEFEADDKTIDAVIRNLQIIGEAAARIPTPIKDKHPDLPRQDIIGFRNIVVREYFGVDETIIWRIVQSELGVFTDKARAILAAETGGE